MTRQFFKDAFLWGCILWLLGYILGIVLFAVMPSPMIGWVIMPIGILATLWVLMKKVKGKSFRYFVFLGVSWVITAIILDYFLLVKVFKPADGYYKIDVYIYYLLTFVLPVVAGWKKILERKLHS